MLTSYSTGQTTMNAQSVLDRADLSGIIIPPKTTPATMSVDQSQLLSAQS